MNENAAVTQEGEVSVQMNKLDKDLSMLLDFVEQLAVKLAPVLRQSAPSGSVPEEKECSRCALGESIHELDGLALSIQRRVLSITERLEL